jgi:hypothetical protein
MVPAIRPSNLSFDFNSDKRKAKAANVSSTVNRNDDFDHNVIPIITSMHSTENVLVRRKGNARVNRETE